MITFDVVLTEYNEALSECRNKIAATSWAVTPLGIDLTSKKALYGEATNNGMVYINKAFLGTHAINKLRSTIRHELAHLCVGLANHHNSRFKRVEAYFNENIVISDAECKSIIDIIQYKWFVKAHLVDGRVVDIGGVHRKTKKYSNYPSRPLEVHKFEGTKVASYEFIQLDK